jgi:hypothetical protein
VFEIEKQKEILTSFGHDQCIFHQNIFTCSAWKGTKGGQAPIPSEFGLGMQLTSAQIAIVNAFQNEIRLTYQETESAVKVNGTAEKRTWTDSPF